MRPLTQKYNIDRSIFGRQKFSTIMPDTGDMKELDISRWIGNYIK